MKKILFILCSIGILLFDGCATTKPRLSYTGGNYHSVSDDILIYNSVQEAISKLVNTLNSNEKHFLVQVVDDANNDFLADRIYEELVKRGFIAGRAKNSELKSVNTDAFDKFIMFYPIVYGTEHAETIPTIWASWPIFIPIAGPFLAMASVASNTYDDRQAGVSLHCRLVDAHSGEIVWIKNFTGQQKIRLRGGLQKIIFPN